jgi:hypothetical protein
MANFSFQKKKKKADGFLIPADCGYDELYVIPATANVSALIWWAFTVKPV